MSTNFSDDEALSDVYLTVILKSLVLWIYR